jgi:hypothetical protein
MLVINAHPNLHSRAYQVTATTARVRQKLGTQEKKKDETQEWGWESGRGEGGRRLGQEKVVGV